MCKPRLDLKDFYTRFDIPVTNIDCGLKCAVYNASGKPFCCDICEAVPAVYDQEWAYLRKHTDLWKEWRGNREGNCPHDKTSYEELRDVTPDNMVLLACAGHEMCQREYRAISCRQFPFYPYVTSDYCFIGLAYEWQFEDTCWVISNLGEVTTAYREAFVGFFDDLFSLWLDEFDSYAALSEEARQWFAAQKRRMPILHRNGGTYLLSPGSERLGPVSVDKLRRFGPYQ